MIKIIIMIDPMRSLEVSCVWFTFLSQALQKRSLKLTQALQLIHTVKLFGISISSKTGGDSTSAVLWDSWQAVRACDNCDGAHAWFCGKYRYSFGCSYIWLDAPGNCGSWTGCVFMLLAVKRWGTCARCGVSLESFDNTVCLICLPRLLMMTSNSNLVAVIGSSAFRNDRKAARNIS